MEYPDDANGDAIRRMLAAGDNLTCPRDIEFTVVFPNGNVAEQFARHFRTLGYAASIEFAETVEELPWDVIIVKNMEPSHSEIGSFEEALQSVASPLGGRNDGWGCFSEHSSSSTAETQ
jgi:hypothetical protein